MLYFTSAPVPATVIPTEMMETIKSHHGSYVEYNRKLRAAVNTDRDIEIFESVISEDMLLSLYDVNVTVYSGSAVSTVMTGDVPQVRANVAAFATKVNGVAYIAFDTDALADVIERDGGVTPQLIEVVESVVEHELVHLLQMERGDLDFVPEGTMWKGRLFTNEYLNEAAIEASKSEKPTAMLEQQLELPWELEAYAISVMTADLEELFEGDKLKLMQRARKQYLSSVNHASRRL